MFGKASSSNYAAEPEIIAGIDFGTGKISVITAEKEANFEEPQITAVDYAQAVGISKGTIVNADRAAKAVRKAVGAVESWIARPVKKATVCFSCAEDMSCVLTSGRLVLGINARPVMEEDLVRVIQLAKDDLAVPSNKTVVHTMPVEYMLDGSVIEDPLTMTGKELKVLLMSVMVPSNVLQSVTNCLQKAGVEAEGYLLKPLASALSVITPDEAQNGAAVIDIGAGTTSITVYSGGHPVYMGTVPVGGDHITNDIAMVLKLPLENAEEIKRRIVLCDGEEEDGNIEFVCNNRTYSLPRSELQEIAECRLEELCADLIIPKIQESGVTKIAGGIVLTGGVAKMAGIDLFMRDIFGLPVRVAVPFEKAAMPQGRNSQEFSSVAGIIKYIGEKNQNPYRYADTERKAAQPEAANKQVSRINIIKDDIKENTKTAVSGFGKRFGKLFEELF